MVDWSKFDWRDFEQFVDEVDGEWQSRAVHGPESPAFFAHIPSGQHAVFQAWSRAGNKMSGPVLENAIGNYQTYRQRDIDLFVAFTPGGFSGPAEQAARDTTEMKVVLISAEGVAWKPKLSRAHQDLVDAFLAWAKNGVQPGPRPVPPGPKPVFTPVSPFESTTERIRALVIANQEYSGSARLHNSVRDAKAFSALLERLGHGIEAHYDLKLRQMDRVIDDFAGRAGRETGVLFYYSGHGAEVDGDNWLLPVDCDSENERELKREALKVDDILERFGRAQFRITILDACRNHPFRGVARGGSGGLAMRGAPPAPRTKGDLICFATAPKSTASDGARGEHGPYTAALLRHFASPGRPISQIMMAVRADVQKATHGGQTPWDNSSLTADWYPAGR